MVNTTALIKKKVRTSDGQVLGKVSSSELDTDNWKITHLRVLLSRHAIKQLQLEPPFLMGVALNLPVNLTEKFGEDIILNVPISEISEIAKS